MPQGRNPGSAKPKLIEDLDLIIVEGADPKNKPKAARWLLRNRYREKFGLTAAEMDAEPYDEVMIHAAIMNLDAKREQREQRRMEQRTQNRSGAL